VTWDADLTGSAAGWQGPCRRRYESLAGLRSPATSFQTDHQWTQTEEYDTFRFGIAGMNGNAAVCIASIDPAEVLPKT
jgi:hypothetical protein